MAQQQQNISIAAPGFQGINTEDSPFEQEVGFALVADNAVVDKYGRIGAREAFKTYTENFNLLFNEHVSMVTQTKEVMRLGSGIINNTIYVLCTVAHLQYDANGVLVKEDYFIASVDGDTITDLSYPTLPYPATLSNADIVYFNDKLYIFSSQNPALVYDGTTITKMFSGTPDVDYIKPQDDTGVIAAEIDGDVATSAYGRLWVAGVNGDYNTIYYSDLLIGTQWYDGRAAPADAQNTGGLIDVSEFWPQGGDRIVGLQAHNNFLIVFGRQSILLYANAQSGDPAGADGIFLQDAISGIGCVNRDAIANTGSDILFVDDSGVRSLGRTIQEKSVPIGDLTRNIRADITEYVEDEPNDCISLAYIPNKNITVCLFSDTRQAFVIEMRAPSTTGGMKVTRWTNCTFNRMLYVEFEDTTYTLLGGTEGDGCYVYDNYLEHTGLPYIFKYESNVYTFGDSVRQKFMKQVDYTLVSTFIDAPALAKWGYGSDLPYSKQLTVSAQEPALFNVAQFTDPNDGTVDDSVQAEYGSGLSTIRRYRVNTKGSGALVRTGFECEIAGNSLAVQEINIQTLLGRIY